MASIFADRGWLVIAFVARANDRRVRVRLYPGLRWNRDSQRANVVREIRELITLRRFEELAARYPENRQLEPWRPKVSARDETTFRQASERFIAYHRNANREGTVRFNLRLLKGHVWPLPEFADKPLRLIGASDIAAVYGPLLKRKHQAQASNVRRVISAVFNWAAGERGADGLPLVVENPARRTRPVSIDRQEESIEPFASEEIARVIAAASGWKRRLVVVAFGAGLEPGENFGLKRQNVDFKAGVIRVRQRWTRYGEGGLKNNDARRRDVEMRPAVAAAMREQIAEVGLRSPWLWAARNGKPHDPHNWSSKLWPEIIKRAEVKRRAFYQCRHTFATLLLTGGADWRYIADQMGHADLQMLQKHYWRWRRGSVAGPTHDAVSEALG